MREAFFQVLCNENLLKHIVSFQKGVKYSTIKKATWCIENGYFSLLKYKKDLFYSLKTMDVAVSKGRLDIVQWLHENHPKTCTIYAMDEAASLGFLHIVQWLHYNRREGCTSKAFSMALRNNHLDVARWLFDNRTEMIDYDICQHSIDSGSIDTIQWVYDNFTFNFNFFMLSNEIMKAVIHNDVNLMEWIDNHKKYNYEKVMIEAAKVGSLKVLQWACRKNISLNNRIDLLSICLGEAIKIGCKDMAEWLFLKGGLFIPTKAIEKHLVYENHILLLQWYESRYGFSHFEKVFTLAVERNLLELVQWLCSIRIIPESTFENYGIRSNILSNIDLFHWFIQREALKVSVEDVDVALRRGEPLVAEWIFIHLQHQHTSKTLFLAVECDCLPIVKKLYKPNCLHRQILLSISTTKNSVLQWLHSTGELKKYDTFFTEVCLTEDVFVKWKILNTPANEHHLFYLSMCNDENINLLEWYYRDVPLTYDFAGFAVRYDLLELLKWIVEHAVVENEEEKTIEFAITCGNLDAVEYLYNRNPFSVVEKIHLIAKYDYAMIEWLYLKENKPNDEIGKNVLFDLMEWVYKTIEH